ncbi:hypothetical protein [Gluconobacter oxydans]|uniref:hypothetical protein n=1 Tax=Gluconobacter oxydans TaxID=442 RepID=UPI00062C6988|nr:hypothetical protein [Gluconobacter oxydans]
MTLPWFLNPWAEVRRLRRENVTSNRIGVACVMDHTATRIELSFLQSENADLRRRIAEMEKWTPRDPRMADPMQIKMLREAQGVKFHDPA